MRALASESPATLTRSSLIPPEELAVPRAHEHEGYMRTRGCGGPGQSGLPPAVPRPAAGLTPLGHEEIGDGKAAGGARRVALLSKKAAVSAR
jgi:hypothetical protein